MTITVHIDTLQSTGLHTYGNYTREEFSVEVTIGKDRRTVRCSPWGEGDNRNLSLYGLAVRFSHGTKVWPGNAIYWFKSGRVNNLRPNIDKSGHFILVGFAEDFDGQAVRSQHNAVA